VSLISTYCGLGVAIGHPERGAWFSSIVKYVELTRGVQVRERLGSDQDVDEVQRNKLEWVGPFKPWGERSRAGIKPCTYISSCGLAASPFVFFNIFSTQQQE